MHVVERPVSRLSPETGRFGVVRDQPQPKCGLSRLHLAQEPGYVAGRMHGLPIHCENDVTALQAASTAGVNGSTSSLAVRIDASIIHPWRSDFARPAPGHERPRQRLAIARNGRDKGGSRGLSEELANVRVSDGSQASLLGHDAGSNVTGGCDPHPDRYAHREPRRGSAGCRNGRRRGSGCRLAGTAGTPA